MTHDPVCGMELDEKRPAAETEYNGRTYYFCSENCKEEFQDDPESYIGFAA
ncbi:MAG: YHS domain-containing protein [Terriglobales bacterium]